MTTANTATTISPLAAVLDATERAVHANPVAAAALFTAAGSSTGPVTTTIALGRHTVQSDEPASLGGQDGFPNPVEYALIWMGGLSRGQGEAAPMTVVVDAASGCRSKAGGDERVGHDASSI